MPHPLRFGVVYDFRNPPDSGRSFPDLYARTLEQIRFVDQLGFDSVWITEHHFVEDGYLPSFIAVAGAVAAVTERVQISSDVLLMPFQQPLRLAEDLAVLDNLSNGRMMVGVGMGYAPHEFKAFGIDRRQRVSLTEEGLDVLKLAWTEDRFSYQGKRYQFDDVQVRPRPVQTGGPPIWIAAMSEPGARRAARFGAHLLPQGDRAAVLDPWLDALKDEDKDPGEYRVGIIRSCLVSDDPDALFTRIRDSARYVGDIYADWIAQDEVMSQQLAAGREAGRTIPQSWIVGGVEDCVAQLTAFVEEFGITDVLLWGVPPGLGPEEMSDNLERFARQVMPRLRGA